MRKNRLIEEMNGVIERNNKLFTKCEKLEKSLAEKDQQLAEMKAASAEITAENELLKAELQSLATALSESENNVTVLSVLDMSDNVEQSSAVTDEKNSVATEENRVEEQKENTLNIAPVYASTALIAEEKIKIASQSIGSVVLNCAELCNTFAAMGNVNSKDLINLALGRTEVFKSEVLTSATKATDLNNLTLQLQEKENDVLEYFELLKNQI